MDSIQVTGKDRFILFTQDAESCRRLSTLLAHYGQLVQADLHHEPGDVLRTQGLPRMVFVDFNVPSAAGEAESDLEAARRLCAYMEERFPRVPRIALTCYDAGPVMVEALRAGASDCIDLGKERDAQHTIRRLMEVPVVVDASAGPRGCSILVLGGRQGMGATSLATHVANLAQARLCEAAAPKRRLSRRSAAAPALQDTRACLLDLGMPARDGLLYLGLPEGFHFLDAVRSLNRLDRTLLDSALLHDDQGLGVLSFPHDLGELREVSHDDALALFNRLQDFFELTVVDVGGLGNPAFEINLAKAAEHIWIVTDQSLGGLLSLASHLEMLRASEVDLHALRLVVNRYDDRLGLSAQQIADKFEIPLLGTLPDSRAFLWQQDGASERRHRTNARHSYMRAVGHLLDLVMEENGCKKRAPVIRGLWDALIPGRRASQRAGEHS